MKNKNDEKGRLLALGAKHGRILSFKPDGSSFTTVLDKCVGTIDGIAVDVIRRHIYWTNMGEHWDQNDGFIERMDFDGANRKLIIPHGATFTPKQLQLDLRNGLMYWCDREGMRVMRSGMDGSNITTLVETGRGEVDRLDESKHCVGIAVDVDNGYIYWTQKGAPNAGEGTIFRAGLDLPPGADAAHRKDIEILWDSLPEPIDLELDHAAGQLYWTDRGDPPEGNSLNRASIHKQIPPDYEILCTDLQEAIGLALDPDNDRAFLSDLGGNLYSCRLDGSERTVLFTGDEMFTGIVYLPGGLD